MEVNSQLHAAAALSPERTQEPFSGRLGGPQSQSERFGEKIKYLTPTETRNLDRPAHSLVAITTTLTRLTEVVIINSILSLPVHGV